MSRECAVYDLMVDIVEMWVRDHNIGAPEGAWEDLIERLSACDSQLRHEFDCQRVGYVRR